jgi:putative nucleotidyltransferase with HDIG domain
MTGLSNYIASNKRIIIVSLLFFIASLITVFILPREGKFMYEYQRGSIWRHDDLYAPFSFPVYKTNDELTRERDSVLLVFRPIFNFNPDVPLQRLAEFRHAFSISWQQFSISNFKITDEVYNSSKFNRHRQLEAGYSEKIAALINSFFDTGIIDLLPLENQASSLTYNEVTVIRNNVAEDYPVEELLTPRKAYQLVLDFIPGLTADDGSLGKQYSGFLQDFPYNNYLTPDITYVEGKSLSIRNSLTGSVWLTRGLVQEGQKIISRGEFITPDKYQLLESLRLEYEKNIGVMAANLVLLGKLIIVLAAFMVIFLFLKNFRIHVLQNYKHVTFILITVLLMITIASAAITFNLASIYLIPLVILPIILKTFFDSRLALFVHMVTVLIIGFYVPNGFEFAFLSVIAGMVAIISLTSMYRRSRMVVAAIFVFITYSVIYLGISLVQEGSLVQIELKFFRWFGINSLMILITYPLIFIFEKLFGFTSDATLVELSDSNQPLLRKLAELAPGTFQHSLQVANLAENAVFRVGGNPLLIRTGALYHDIGKMENPQFFIENQSEGFNPHSNIEFEESARIIIDHVNKGVEMAKKYRLPDIIIDFIVTHHGTSTVQFFYKSYLNKYPDSEVDIKNFSYPGPKPFSKEMAILMMADSVEAASRSIKGIDGEAIDQLVDKIIKNQMQEGQYDNAGITFRDISVIKELFKQMLRNIYHLRIKYPE